MFHPNKNIKWNKNLMEFFEEKLDTNWWRSFIWKSTLNMMLGKKTNLKKKPQIQFFFIYFFILLYLGMD
jgi:hypothetical protein